MQSIEGKVDQSKLNKVRVNDRSAPYIPKDIEIYFYSRPNSDKKAAPPPASRDRFHKTPFWTKKFPINFRPQIYQGKYSTQYFLFI
jgi:hypothetical protein